MKFQDPLRRSFASSIEPLLRSEFEVVVVDRSRGSKYLETRMAGVEPGSAEHSRFLELFPDTVQVIVAEDRGEEEKFVRMIHMPSGEVCFQFNDQHHQEAAGELIDRVVRLLGLKDCAAE